MTADDARVRFAAATRAHLTGALTADVDLQHVEPAGWHAVADPLMASADDRLHINPAVLVPAADRVPAGDLDAVLGTPLEHRVLFTAGGEVVGAYWGAQEAHARYYMVGTFLRRDWQGRGLYRAFLPRVVAAAAAAGFVEVFSRHRADNNAILVPKLKAGFTIAAFEVSPRHGLLVHLRRYLRATTGLVHRFRIDATGAAELRAAGLPLP